MTPFVDLRQPDGFETAAAGYTFGLLAPSATAGAAEANAPWLGPMTLGIEVTEPALARRCGLGNIDPQHGCGHGDGPGRGASAIEAALHWPPPPRHARLVTVRPDADAIGAMAILALRALGGRPTATLLDRAVQIARCDAFAQGAWCDWMAGREPLSRPARPEDMSMFPSAYRALAAAAGNPSRSLAERVDFVGRWLVGGVLDDGALAAAEAHARRLAEAWNSGALEIEVLDDARVARVRGDGGLQLGYRFAPVVIAEGHGDAPRKVTIGQFAVGHVDLVAVSARLSALEPGWGGSPTIIGSPQGVGARLPDDTIAAVVMSALI